MRGIDLNKPILFKHASLRYFAENEHHISRLCGDDVLVLVFSGVLRFTEDGVSYEIHPGEYHIQKHGSVQTGEVASDAPKYLYVHFYADWAEESTILPYCGSFDYAVLRADMEALDALSHGGAPLVETSAKFYSLLLQLCKKDSVSSLAAEIASFIEKADLKTVSLTQICQAFNFSKNHIINVFKKAYGTTPVQYINNRKLQRAKYLLEVTSDTLERIALESGFNDYAYFYKLFCRENGSSPNAWRKKKRRI